MKNINPKEFNTKAEARQEEGKDHYKPGYDLLKLLHRLDINDVIDLELGGEGDVGEILAFYLDELAERGILEITVHPYKLQR